jgi:hypothetical protein
MKSIALLLAHATMEHVNSCVSARDLRTPLHLACAMGNLPVAQLLIWVSQLSSFCINCQIASRITEHAVQYIPDCKRKCENKTTITVVIMCYLFVCLCIGL